MENTVVGMDAVVNSIATELSSANLWGVVGSIVPILAISILFGLGFTLIRRILNKTKKARGGM